MPRFFFHLHNDIDSLDEEGRELANIDAARRCAEEDARHMAAENVRQGRLVLSHYVEVADAGGERLFRITFGEAVAVFGTPGARTSPGAFSNAG